MATKYLINGVDTDALYIRKDKFIEGNLWAWGIDSYGQLGDNTTTNKSSPVQTIAGGTNWKNLSTGRGISSSIKTDGTLWLWGYDSYGALGDNSSTNKSSPVQTVTNGTTWKQSSHGHRHSSAIKTDGTLWTWGYNTYGQLGNNSTLSVSSPIQTITGGTNWKQVSSGYYHTAAIKTDGTLWLWGANGANTGQLGDNTTTNRSSPVQTFVLGNTWKQVSCGYYHTTAIKTDGTLWTWGFNGTGQLGHNTITSRSIPVQTITGGTNWKQVSAGQAHTSAIKTDGTLWTWGYDQYGQLGNNSSTNTSSPVQTITGGTNWKQVSSGFYHTAAIKTDGTLWTWGYNNYGQLGNNSTTRTSSPVQTVAGGTNWKQVSCGGYHTIAITESPL